jgi:NTE family protein
MIENKKIGLCLSGGGFRAAAFHLGTLRKLNELNILNHVDVISTISGGSIAGAFYALNKNDFPKFEADLKAGLKKSVIRRIIFSFRIITSLLLFAAVPISIRLFFHHNGFALAATLFLVLLTILFQFYFIPLTKLKARVYDKIFFKNQMLKNLPDQPKIAINATNLETGTLFTFSKSKVSDSSYEFPNDGKKGIKFRPDEIPISLAVAASTSVPFIFNPIKIGRQYFEFPDDYNSIAPRLSDGGIYDNQGIHKLSQSNSTYYCDIIICSDGSQPFAYRFNGSNSFQVLYRANDIMMRKIKSLQFIRDVYSSKNEIAYFSLDWDYENCILSFVDALDEGKVIDKVIEHHGLLENFKTPFKPQKKLVVEYLKKKIDFEIITANKLSKEEIIFVSKIRTGLSAFNDIQIALLARHGAVLTELQIKLYCPTLMM